MNGSCSLFKLSSDALEHVCSYLKSRHLMRLVWTGDAELHVRLGRLRGLTVSVVQPRCNLDGVNGMLLRVARSVRISDHDAYMAGAAVMSNLVDLRLEPASELDEHGYLQCVDLRAFSKLESLSARRYDLKNSLLLPTSLTSLKLDDFSCSSGLHLIGGMEKMSSLTRLRMDQATEANLYSLRTHAPPNLVSLSVTNAKSLVESLPRSLTRLRILMHRCARYDDRVDVCAVLEACPRLSSLRLDVEALIDRRMPEGLSHLALSYGVLVAKTGATLRESFERMPASLTRLQLGRLYHTYRRDEHRLLESDVLDAMRLAVPRMSFQDVDLACRAVLRSYRMLAPDSPLLLFLRGALASHGIDKDVALRYLRSVSTNINVHLPCKQLSTEMVCSALAAGFTPRDIRRLLAGAELIFHFPHLATNRREYRAHAIQLLEIGASDVLWMLDKGDVATAVDMSALAARNLVHLNVGACRDTHGVLGALLRSNEFVALKSIFVTRKEPCAIDDVASILCECHQNVPRLDSFVYAYPSLFRGHYAPSAEVRERMERTLGLFPCEGSEYTASFRYLANRRTDSRRDAFE